MPTLFIGGKAFAGLYADATVFKFAGPDHPVALALPGAGLFDPSGMVRPMTAWVQVPLERATDCSRQADRALEVARAQT